MGGFRKYKRPETASPYVSPWEQYRLDKLAKMRAQKGVTLKKTTQRNYRLPIDLQLRLRDLTYQLKLQDPTWSETRIVEEALEFYLDVIRQKQRERAQKKGLV